MKIIDDLDNLKGKTIAFAVESWNDNVFVLATTEDELIFIGSEWNSSREEADLRVLNFSQAKWELKNERHLFNDIENEKPGILKDVTDEIKIAVEKKKEAEEYKLYQKLEKKYGHRSTLSGPIF